MLKRFRQILDLLGYTQTIQAIGQAEFVRTVLWPFVLALMTGAAGIAGSAPLMWVLMASALTFMAMTTALLNGSIYIERKNPVNKLGYNVIFNHDLNPARPALLGSRQQRRASRQQHQQLPDLSPTQLDVNVTRTIAVGQLGLELKNNATFPISVYLENAETEVEEFTPPRSKFPKGHTIIGPGEKIRMVDDRITMDDFPCQRLAGKVNMRVRYGLPGNEKFSLDVEGTVVIVIEHFGFVSQIQFSPKSQTETLSGSTTG